MPSENDVRRAIDELGAESVPVGRALHNLSRRLEARVPRRRARTSPQVLVAAVVLAIVAIATVGAALLRPTHHSATAVQPPAASPGPTTSEPCAVTDTPGLDSLPVRTVPGLSTSSAVTQQRWCSGARIRGFYSRTLGEVTVIVYQPGVFHATDAQKLPTVTGHGITAHTGLLAPDFKVDAGCGVEGASMALPQPRCAARRTVAWSYAADAWATVSSTGRPARDALPAATVTDAELLVAAAVEPLSSSQYLLPFRIANLGDLRPQSLSSTITGVSVNLAPAGLDRQCDPFDGCVSVNATSPYKYFAAVSPVTGKPANTLPTGRKVNVNGHPATVYYATATGTTERVVVRTGYWTYTVSADARLTGLTTNQLLELARRIQLAPGRAGTSGWFTAQQALQR